MQRLEDGSFYDPSLSPTKPQGEKLEAGDHVHDAIFRSIQGVTYKPTDFTDKKVWIAFYRYAGCPMCAAHFDEAMSFAKKLKDGGVLLLAVFDAGPDKIPDRMKTQMSETCIIVGNDSKGLFETFGVEKSWLGLLSVGSIQSRIEAGRKGYSEQNIDGAINRMPAHIFLKPGGDVVLSHYGRHAGDHVPWKNLWDFVAQEYEAPEDSLKLML
jgi:peroxiredoxin Q/BCP